ncbi:MAG: DNA/RNA nuclease SfsA [Clostridia bacterium]|nr:DNA/RNA nuclease SfsA [Clostridia bacterium]
MIYNNIKEGVFLSRTNRFIASIEVDGKVETCHVKNTGRCRELLIPGAKVYVQESDNPLRKTRYDLVSVYKGTKLFNIDSIAPNKVFAEWASNSEYFGISPIIKSECRYGNSRFDFYIESDNRKIFVEVKGVTLEKDGVLMFPDAPTERGLKHINELLKCVNDGYEAYVVFIAQTDEAEYFTPNRKTHNAFAEALVNAQKGGVKILCLSCNVKHNEISVKDFVKVCIL